MSDHEQQQQPEQQPEQALCCWICHSGSSRRAALTRNFCRCTGTLGAAHQQCLQKFITTTGKDSCPTCNTSFEFLDFSETAPGQRGPPPPRPGNSTAATTTFLLRHFLAPITSATFVAFIEVVLHCVAIPLLLGAILFVCRGGAYIHSQMTAFDAWIVGFVLLVLRRKIFSGQIEIIETASPSFGLDENGNGVGRPVTAAELMARMDSSNDITGSAGSGAEDDDEQQRNDDSAANNEAMPILPPPQQQPGQAAAPHQFGTIDQVLWRTVRAIQNLARHPDSPQLDILSALLASFERDVQFLLVACIFIGVIPKTTIALVLGYICYVSIRCPAPSLSNPRERYTEAAQVIRSNCNPETDHRRYSLIYAMDVLLLYVLLPLMVGIVARESLTLPASFLDDPFDVVGLVTDFLLRVHNRLANCIEHPRASIALYTLGYMCAGCISFIESRLIAPVIAPGVSLVFFRSFHVAALEEAHSFSFMLRQIVDLSPIAATQHCVALFASFLSLTFGSVFTLTNLARFMYTVTVSLPIALATVAESPLRQQQVEQEMQPTAAENNASIAGTSSLFEQLAVTFFLQCRSRLRLMTVATPSYSDSPWYFTFVLTALAVAGTTFYLLPHQYMILRRCLPLLRGFGGGVLGLHDYLFDDAQQDRVDEFMALSKTLPEGSTDNIVELPSPDVPIWQTAIRRERFLPAEKVPRNLKPRVTVLMMAVLGKLLWDFMLTAANAFFWFGSAIGILKQLGFVEQQDTYFCTGLELLALSFLLVLAHFPTALGIAAGYVLVTPLALLIGFADAIKPASFSLAKTVESVWVSTFRVQRIVVPRTAASTAAAAG